ncbi:MAG: hypothetical protein IPN19_09835 [Elusimicrobia bacterium]|nr:hypothetical protein [Elusimicrobiota bacterium]
MKPFSSVQELAPEELEPLKDLLLAHLRSHSPTAREVVDKNLHVTRGERVPAYALILHSLVENRELVAAVTVKPLTPELAEKTGGPLFAPAGPAGVAPELWAHPSETRSDFSPHSDTYFVAGSLQIKECNDCFQKGESGCKACAGKGVESCSVCLGAGHQTCVFCKGAEKVSCLRCGGEGKLASGEVGGRVARCDACGGTGKFPCTHCQGGKVLCPQCQGSGKATCEKCKGKGKVVCAVCAGHKKIVSGQSFRASFKPSAFRQAVFVVDGGTKQALDMALEKGQPSDPFDFDPAVPPEQQVVAADPPAPVRIATVDLLKRESKNSAASSRVVKRRLELIEGSLVRITGYCAGQEFAYWVDPASKRVVAEKDPLTSFGMTAATSAEEARVAGDWKKALALARESLSFSPDQTIARFVVNAFRRQVVREVLVAGVMGGAVSAFGHSLWLLFFVKGLHKSGAVLQVGAAQFVLGPLIAVALIPFLLKVPRGLHRFLLLTGMLCAGFVMATAMGRWSAEWNPIQAADQAALDRELDGHFKYGVPEVFYEPDLRFLQALQNKYRDTEADQTRLTKAVALQLELKTKKAARQDEFETRVREIAYSGNSTSEKRRLLTKLTNTFRVEGIDVSAGEDLMKSLAPAPKRSKPISSGPTSRMDIYSNTPLGRTPKSNKPAGVKSAARKQSLLNKKPTAVPAKKPTLGEKKKAWWE